MYIQERSDQVCRDGAIGGIRDIYIFHSKNTHFKTADWLQNKRIETRTINAWVELYTQLPQLQSYFDICLMPALNNTLECIKQETHYVILLVCTLGGRETVKGLYIFKDMFTVWDQPDTKLQQKRTIQCVSSVCYDMSETLYFFRGFVHSIKELYYQKKGYGVLTIEHNSHNDLILQRWNCIYMLLNRYYSGVYQQYTITNICEIFIQMTFCCTYFVTYRSPIILNN